MMFPDFTVDNIITLFFSTWLITAFCRALATYSQDNFCIVYHVDFNNFTNFAAENSIAKIPSSNFFDLLKKSVQEETDCLIKVLFNAPTFGAVHSGGASK